MRFPNAYKGVSKLFLAGLLELIGAVVGIIAGVLMVSAILADPEGLLEGAIMTAGVSSIVVAVAAVVGIIAFILNLVGLAQAKKDEGAFKIALIFSIICVALSIIGACILTINPFLADWMDFVVTIFELCVFEYVVVGIMSLARQLGDEKMVAFGSKMRMVISILYIVILFIRIFGRFNIDFAGVASMVVGIVELVLYIAYLIYLKNAKTMLAK